MAQPILITGGAGFIGGCFVRQWLAETDRDIVNLDKLTYAGNLDSIEQAMADPRHTFIQGDVCDQQRFAEILRQHRPSAVIHFAAESHVDRSIDGPEEFIQTNIIGTFRLLQASLEYWRSLDDAARDAFRFLYISTDEIHGSAGPDEFFNEQTNITPNSPYSASKASGGHLAASYHATYGLPVLQTVCSNNYGPYQFPEKLIPLMILNAVEGKPLPMYGDGMQQRDWLHVEDHCTAVRLVLEKGIPGHQYHVGAEGPQTNKSVIEKICACVDEFCPDLPHRPTIGLVQSVTDRPGHDKRYAIDSSKLREQLGWQPRYDFAQGLRDTVKWYLDHSDWVERVASGGYRRERLGQV